MVGEDPTQTRGTSLRWKYGELVTGLAAVSLVIVLATPRLHRAYRDWRIRTATDTMLAAADRADVEGVSKAIAAGADPQAFDIHGHSAVYYALRDEDVRLLRVLVNSGVPPNAQPGPNGLRPLRLAIRINDLALARHVLDAGSDPNNRFYYPLHCCIEHGSVEMMELLLARGADIEAETRQLPIKMAAHLLTLHAAPGIMSY